MSAKDGPMPDDEKRVMRAYGQLDAMKRIVTILGTLPPEEAIAICEWLRRTVGAKDDVPK